MKAKKGDVVTIVANTVRHQFYIGTIVKIKELLYVSGEPYGYHAEYLDGSDYWYIQDADFLLRRKRKRKPKKKA